MAKRRVRGSWWPVAQAAVASAIAWLVAHRLLGHPQPFFAPIAAAISLSTSRIQRSRRIVQMVGGVLLGIAIGEALASALGTSTVALGAIVFATMGAALLSGVGFFSEGMMFANQAAASAILVVTLHRRGTGAERAVDVLVGGAVAFAIGVVLFPAEPMSLLRDAERAVLRTLADRLTEAVALLRSGEPPDSEWTLRAGSDIHQQLAALARARATAHANVRIAPRRWHLRAVVDAENRRTARLDLLANAVLGLIRAAGFQTSARRPVPSELEQQIAALALAIGGLSAAGQPWAPELLDEVGRVAAEAIGHSPVDDATPGPVLASILRATATDLVELIGSDR